MDDELRCLIDSIEKRFDQLRQADREAVKLAHEDMARRLEGFPGQFATKVEQEAARQALQRLEKDSLTREIYESNHRVLADLVARLDKEKMPEAVFQTFLENYRIEQENAAVERRAVASVLATATAREGGQTATWRQIAALILGAVAVLSFVVLIANTILR